MPRFKRLQKKQNSDQPISISQGTESTPFLQSMPCLPTNPTTSCLSTKHLSPSVQPTSQPSRTIHLASYPAPMDQATSQQAPKVYPTSYPSRLVHSTSCPTPTDQHSSQPSRSIHLASHPTSMDQATSQQAPTVYPTSHPFRSVHLRARLAPTNQHSSQPSRSVHSTSHSASTDQNSTQPAPTVQATSRKRYGRESATHWGVDAIDSRDNAKRLKVKVSEVLNLSGEERIIVNFDILDEPFGDARSLLSGFCGILACDCFLFSINFEKWPSVPISYFNRVFDQIIKLKFSFNTIESIARRHVCSSIGKKWAANRNNLWKWTEDPSKSKAEIMDKVPLGIPRDQWISFIEYQYKDSTKDIHIRNTKNRKKQTIPHTGGSKANATRRAEMMAETGQRPGRAQIYIATHKNKDVEYM